MQTVRWVLSATSYHTAITMAVVWRCGTWPIYRWLTWWADLPIMAGGLEHVLCSISYMGRHPSHWRTPSFFKMVIAPPTRVRSVQVWSPMGQGHGAIWGHPLAFSHYFWAGHHIWYVYTLYIYIYMIYEYIWYMIVYICMQCMYVM